MSSPPSDLSYRYCGRIFSIEEIDRIRNIIISNPQYHRYALSKIVCRQLQWIRPNGQLKDMSCRVAMLRMHRDGIISLPCPQRKNGNGKIRPKLSTLSDPQKSIVLPAGKLGNLVVQAISTKKDSIFWNELIERYHYLGYTPLSGAQIRYFVFTESNDLLAALSFGAAAWSVAPRDRFIGWTHQQRKENLHLVINNARFLILPWINSKNLASRILSTVTKQLPHDWQFLYNYTPVAVETFVQKDRFKGTCYNAANWKLVGETQGRGKLGRNKKQSLPIKYIYVYPLNKSFRCILCPE